MNKLNPEVLRALERFSIMLHGIEAKGIDIPKWLDEVWLKITTEVQKHYTEKDYT